MDEMNNVMDQAINTMTQQAQEAGLQTTVMEPVKKGYGKVVAAVGGFIGGTTVGILAAEAHHHVKDKKAVMKKELDLKKAEELENKAAAIRNQYAGEAIADAEFIEVDDETSEE